VIQLLELRLYLGRLFFVAVDGCRGRVVQLGGNESAKEATVEGGCMERVRRDVVKYIGDFVDQCQGVPLIIKEGLKFRSYQLILSMSNNPYRGPMGDIPSTDSRQHRTSEQNANLARTS